MPVGDYNPVPRVRKYVLIPCDGCGQEIRRRKDQVNQRGTGSFCKSCVASKSSLRMKGNTINPKTQVKLICKQCGKEFSYFKYKAMIRKFCSRKCCKIWQRENIVSTKFISKTLSGKDHPRYSHGKRVGKHENKPKIRASVAERDGGKWCLLCGKPGPGLHLHRVIYGSECGKYEVTNCVLLCGEHHGLVHSSKRTWQPFLMKYLQMVGTDEGRQLISEKREEIRSRER